MGARQENVTQRSLFHPFGGSGSARSPCPRLASHPATTAVRDALVGSLPKRVNVHQTGSNPEPLWVGQSEPLMSVYQPQSVLIVPLKPSNSAW